MQRVLARDAYRTYGPIRTGFWTAVHTGLFIACLVGAAVSLRDNFAGALFLCAPALGFAWLARAYGATTRAFVRAAKDLRSQQIYARVMFRPHQRTILGRGWVLVAGNTGLRFTEATVRGSPPIHNLGKVDVEIGDLAKGKTHEFEFSLMVDGDAHSLIGYPGSQVALLYDFVATPK